MDDQTKTILLELLSLTQANANSIQRVLMLHGDASANEAELLSILRSIEIANNGCEMTLARIEAL